LSAQRHLWGRKRVQIVPSGGKDGKTQIARSAQAGMKTLKKKKGRFVFLTDAICRGEKEYFQEKGRGEREMKEKRGEKNVRQKGKNRKKGYDN